MFTIEKACAAPGNWLFAYVRRPQICGCKSPQWRACRTTPRACASPIPLGLGGVTPSAFASEVAAIAESVLRHRLPLLGQTIETGREIDWRRDYVNGISTGTAYFRRIPYLDFSRAGDHKNVWELNRHQHLVVLAQAFLMTGKKEYLAEITTQMASWMEQNPLGGESTDKRARVAFRALSWIRVDEMIGAQWAADFRGKVLSGVWQHGRYLESNLSVYFSPNTHLLGEAVVLHAIGLRLADSPRSARWRSLGDRIVHEEMERQVEADGSHFERSTYYHIYALDFFVLHAALAKPGAAFLQKLALMAEFLASVMDDAGAIPLIGDDDGGRLFHPYGARPLFGRASLAASAVLLEREEWPFATEDLQPFAAWLFGARALRRGMQEYAAGPGAVPRLRAGSDAGRRRPSHRGCRQFWAGKCRAQPLRYAEHPRPARQRRITHRPGDVHVCVGSRVAGALSRLRGAQYCPDGWSRPGSGGGSIPLEGQAAGADPRMELDGGSRFSRCELRVPGR